jgi:lysophospholipase L1-like esterase
MTEQDTPFDYTNLTGRPSGPVVRLLSRVVPGVRQVQDQVAPYAGHWRASNLSALEQSGPLWCALGDSMTLGIGASAFDRGWVGQLAEQGSVPRRLINLSASGARVADILDRQLPALEALGIEPALVTVLIGSNDLISPRYRKVFPELFGQMLRRLPVGSVVASQPNPSRAALEANATLDRIAAERGLVIADLRDPRTTSWKGRLAPDHFHPNDLGYAGIAEVFAGAIGDRPAA